MSAPTPLSTLIHKLREQKKPPMSRRKLARLLGVGAATICRWEQGGGIESRAKRQLAKHLNRSLDELDLYIEGGISYDEFIGNAADDQKEASLDRVLSSIRLMSIEEWVEISFFVSWRIREWYEKASLKAALRDSAESTESGAEEHW